MKLSYLMVSHETKIFTKAYAKTMVTIHDRPLFTDWTANQTRLDLPVCHISGRYCRVHRYRSVLHGSSCEAMFGNLLVHHHYGSTHSI